ncbi:putative quinol monooxygenase [Haladaptatus halobius]|uniref:putative quinol monooxygenase n=1 Tax=Haladaptatus halobius TaxID=2884875 RepID=UPI001D09A537|nr:antibiotic biosynthesis monooxygenase [Haladaptatus halobius]
MTYLLGKASVEDFKAWKSAFERFDSFRTDHGQQGYQVFQSVDDPTEIVVLFEWADDEDPRAFFASEEMRERLAEAGVKGRPEMTELEFIDQRSAQHPSA